MRPAVKGTRDRVLHERRSYQRTYRACIACKKSKSRCDLGRENRPPCARCQRQWKECLFEDDDRAVRVPKQTRDAGRDSSTATRGDDEYSFRDDNVRDAAEDSAVDGPTLEPESPCQPHITRSLGRDARQRDADGTVSQTADHGYDLGGQATSLRDIYDDHPNTESPASGMSSAVIRTVVSSGNDALNILFEAASRDRGSFLRETDVFANHNTPRPMGWQGAELGQSPSDAQRRLGLSSPSDEVLSMWMSCRFVTMGWLTAREAVILLDLFFLNLAPQSPILTDYYASPDHHYQLITQEPMLCCTLLLISSRYHILPGLAGMSKSYFLHNRLWKHWQTLFTRVMFGQEKGTSTGVRTIGTVESLIIMTEWHPRSLHFPPEGEGWDSDLIHRPPDRRPEMTSISPSERWLEEVIEPARRSDRMSWMLLGSALSLGHELGVFDPQPASTSFEQARSGDSPDTTVYLSRRKLRIQKLLHVFINQLASRLGYTSLMPHSLNLPGGNGYTAHLTEDERRWDDFMAAWIGLTKLSKSISDVFFPSRAETRQHLSGGRYVGLLDHFSPLLTQWREVHLDRRDKTDKYYRILFVEYHHTFIFLNSLGLQAIIERNLLASNSAISGGSSHHAIALIDAQDQAYVQAIITSSLAVLSLVTELASSDALRFSPVRVYLRITSSSVFLLKAMCLGVRQAEMLRCLDILETSTKALKSCTLDDMHLAPRYATLLEVHVVRLRRHFMASLRNGKGSTVHTGYSGVAGTQGSSTHSGAETSVGRSEPRQDLGSDMSVDMGVGATMESSNINVGMDAIMSEPQSVGCTDDWLSLPFDPSMAPFGMAGIQVFPGLEEGALDFMWNLQDPQTEN